MPRSILQLRSAWAEALASLNHVGEEKVALLLQLCTQPPSSDGEQGTVVMPTVRDTAANILPLIGFVDKSGGQQVDLIMPEVARQLPLLGTDWARPVGDPESLEQLFDEVFTSLRRLLHNEDIQLQWRTYLSTAVRQLLTRLVQTVLHMPTNPPAPASASAPSTPPSAPPTRPLPLPMTSPAQIMLRNLTRSKSFASRSGLPLLPADAEAMLTWMTETVLPPGGKITPSGPMNPPPGSRAALAASAAADEKVLLLMAQLARTMLAAPPGSGVTTTEQFHVGNGNGHGTASASQDGNRHPPSGAPTLTRRLSIERSLLTTLLSWSMGLVRGVLRRLLQPASGMEALNPALLMGKAAAAAVPPPPSAGVTRAAVRLAASAMHGLLVRAMGEGAGGLGTGSASSTTVAALPAASRTQLMDVISMLLDMSEACVSAALDIGPQIAASDKMLDTAAYILEDCSSLIITAAREAATAGAPLAPTANGHGPSSKIFPSPVSLNVGTVFSRLKAILLAAATLVGQEPSPPPPQPAAAAAGSPGGGGGWGSFWAWDVTRPLTASYASGTRTPGWGAQRICCNVAEALTCGLAASYNAGAPTYVQALLLLPLSLSEGPSGGATTGSGSASEAQVLSLTMGRLLVLLRGDERLARSMVPLLTDVLGLEAAGSPAVVSVQASVVQTLAAIAAASAVHERSLSWAYTQIADVLCRLLLDARQPKTAAAALATSASCPGAGALSAGLLVLAKGVRSAAVVVRRDLRNRLLVLFSELGTWAGGAERAGVVAEMGQLLLAVAEACEGLESSAFCLSASRFSLADLVSMQQRNGAGKADGQMVKLLRNLWLYCALFGLCRSETATPEQLAAAGRIAARTPVLLLGEAAPNEGDMTEQLKAEIGDRLRLAGESAATPARLRTSLQAMLGVPLGGTPQPPPDANKQAYLLTVATAELCRVRHAPLTADDESSPIAVPLIYLQSAKPRSADAAWYGVIADKAFDVYLERLKQESATETAGASAAACAAAADDRHHVTSHPSGRGSSYVGLSSTRIFPSDGVSLADVGLTWPGEPDSAEAEAAAAEYPSTSDRGAMDAQVSEQCLEILAVTLIRHLGAAGGHEEGLAPQAALVADRLLKRLLAAYSPIYWSYSCVQALLTELEAEEGLDHPLSEVHAANNLSSYTAAAIASSGTGGTVWRWLRKWIYAAATAAPTRTEALLHQFLGQSSIAAYTLGDEGGLSGGGALPGAASTGPASGLAGGTSQHHHANVAALRRAADLLAVCADARRQEAVGAGAGVASDATRALCRKQFFTGIITGVQYLSGGSTSGPAGVAELALAGLEEGMAAARHNARLLEQRYLGAAAFLARQAADEADQALSGSAVHAVCDRMLQGLCMAPLRRFTPDMMGLAVFAWTWITTAGPGWLVPLVSRAAAAWARTVDQGMGLFSGGTTTRHLPGDHGSRAAAADGVTNDSTIGDDSDVTATTSTSGPAYDSQLLAALACHHQWVAFLFEMWSSAADRTDTERSAMASVYDRLLHHSLSRPERLASHPAAAAPLFRLLQLALAYVMQCTQRRGPGAPCPPAQALLYYRVLHAGLVWFAHPVSYTARMSQRQALEQHAAMKDFGKLLQSFPSGAVNAVAGPVFEKDKHRPSVMEAATWTSRPSISEAVWGPAGRSLRAADLMELLLTLCRAEEARLQVWARPLVQPGTAAGPTLTLSEAQVKTAWKVSPQLAINIVQRCPSPVNAHSAAPRRVLESLLIAAATDPRVQALPEAALVLATQEAARANAPYLAALATWAPAGAVQGLQLMCGPAQLHAGVKAYALRCLHAAPPAKVAFFLPQLVQALRNDTDGATGRFLLDTAASDDLFAHQLVWALAAEERPPQEAFNPEVKRSGWQPPKETGLWDPATQLKARVLDAMKPESAAFWHAEAGYFDRVTSISGILKKLEPEERRAKIRSELERFVPTRPDLYVPTNPDCIVCSHIPDSGTPMQSAAKVPILVAFNVAQQKPAPMPPLNKKLACIFKVGDDVRQDVLALQVISILRDTFQTAGLDLYLRPYGCIPTGYERGIIEVVPNTKSRAAEGELSDRGLYDIFVSKFGPPGTPAFEAARRNFITSEAGYAIASYLLQAKDRHNGNLLIDGEGHLVHIDFGFILEISPGGNLGFESAAFKLSHEMTQLLDPGGMRNSAHFRLFEELCVRGYLAARTVAEPIIATVGLMADSGLPCFGYGKPMANLRKRFRLDLSEAGAAAFMRGAIGDAYQKWTTGFYDYIQALQNRIPY